jgi:hypothetical protein
MKSKLNNRSTGEEKKTSTRIFFFPFYSLTNFFQTNGSTREYKADGEKQNQTFQQPTTKNDKHLRRGETHTEIVQLICSFFLSFSSIYFLRCLQLQYAMNSKYHEKKGG